MRVRHPDGSDDYVAVDGTLVSVATDGTFEVPEDADGWLQRWCDANDYDSEAVRVTATCETVKTDGEVCGRELPCPYHSEED